MIYLRVIFILLAISPSLIYSDDIDLINKSYDAYVKGETATTLEERSRFFNEALSYYTQLERPNSTGELLCNIGNCYYQLSEYPWAILYYNRALIKLPREEKIKNNLAAAENKAGVSVVKNTTLTQLLLFFHTSFSVEERVKFSLIASIMILGIFSLAIWSRTTAFYKLGIWIALVGSLFLGSILTTLFFSPVNCVCIKSTPLFRDAGAQYSHILEKPILAGSVLKVNGSTEKGDWLKIELPNGVKGYVPGESVRII